MIGEGLTFIVTSAGTEGTSVEDDEGVLREEDRRWTSDGERPSVNPSYAVSSVGRKPEGG